MGDEKREGPSVARTFAKDVAHVASRARTFAKDVVLVAFVLLIATGVALAVTLMSHPVAQSAADFSLAASPPSGSVAPGNSTTTTVTASSASTSIADVRFACADLPVGAACAFVPPSCHPTCSADLVLFTAANTPTGTHVVTVAATDGAVSRSTTFTVNVSVPTPPPPLDFSIGLNPASGSTMAGNAAMTNVSTTFVSGSTHAVEFACSNVPPGARCTFAPESCSPTCAVTLTVTTTKRTPTGIYAINVTASDGSVSKTATYSLAVSHPPTATTLTFQKGDGSPHSLTYDAYIYSGAPNTSFGYGPLLLVDGNNCIVNHTSCRALVGFPDIIGPNVGQVPANATILSATLQLSVTNDGTDQRLYQVNETWNESSASWNHFATPGMPRSKGPTMIFNTTLGPNALNITGIAQNWARGDPNDGVFIWSPGWNGSDYQSSESGRPPMLTVTFLPGSPPPVVTSESNALEGSQEPSSARSLEPVSSAVNAYSDVSIATPDPLPFPRIPLPRD